MRNLTVLVGCSASGKDTVMNRLIKEFDIKPVILNQTNKSCPNCKYASICFHTEKDNVYIDTKGDDENAELD